MWSLTRHEWGDLHFWLSVAVVAILVLHVALHWAWVVSLVRRMFQPETRVVSTPTTRWIAGLATLAILTLAGLGFWRFSLSQIIATRGGSSLRHGAAGHDFNDAATPPGQRGVASSLRGSMTLTEVAQATGLPMVTVRQRLGLSSQVPDDTRLGWLIRDTGLTMQQVRQRLASDSPPAAPPDSPSIGPTSRPEHP